jgi:hypothetical protein
MGELMLDGNAIAGLLQEVFAVEITTAIGTCGGSDAAGPNLWSARAHRRHTYATVLPGTIDGIRAHFGNPTQITLLRMPVSAGSLHEKTVPNGGYGLLCLVRAAAGLGGGPRGWPTLGLAGVSGCRPVPWQEVAVRQFEDVAAARLRAGAHAEDG